MGEVGPSSIASLVRQERVLSIFIKPYNLSNTITLLPQQTLHHLSSVIRVQRVVTRPSSSFAFRGLPGWPISKSPQQPLNLSSEILEIQQSRCHPQSQEDLESTPLPIVMYEHNPIQSRRKSSSALTVVQIPVYEYQFGEGLKEHGALAHILLYPRKHS